MRNLEDGTSMVSCDNPDCLEEKRFSCNRCSGEFCFKHFTETHPNGVCIHE